MTTPDDGFDATDAVPKIIYNNGDTHYEIPEPTTDQMVAFWEDGYASTAEFLRKMAEIEKQFAVPTEDGPDGAEVPVEESDEARDARVASLRDAREGLTKDLRHKTNTQLAAVCSGTPSVEELEALGHRVQTAFSAYIRKVFAANPEA